MKLSVIILSAVALLAGCSNHKCKLDSDGKKEAFGVLAGMTAGAFNCSVEGHDAKAEELVHGASCEVGDRGCSPMMYAIHAKTTVAAVAPRYKEFHDAAGLEAWPLTAYQASR